MPLIIAAAVRYSNISQRTRHNKQLATEICLPKKGTRTETHKKKKQNYTEHLKRSSQHARPSANPHNNTAGQHNTSRRFPHTSPSSLRCTPPSRPAKASRDSPVDNSFSSVNQLLYQKNKKQKLETQKETRPTKTKNTHTKRGQQTKKAQDGQKNIMYFLVCLKKCPA